MKKVALDFLKDLMSKASPTGWEEPGQEVVAAYMCKYADSVQSDTMGNIHGVLNPGARKRIMLAGHCDEIGLMVQHIDKDGFLVMSALGGVNVTILQGERLKIKTAKGDIPGVFAVKPIHLMTKEERGKPADKIHDLLVDIGAKNRKDAEKYVAIGDTAVIDTGWVELQNGKVAARGFDNRVGSFVIADVIRRLKGKKIGVAVHAISTVQEEVGLRGAKVSAFGVDPHLGIAVDVGFSSDVPEVNEKIVGEAALGKGPILHCGPTYNKDLLANLQATAKKSEIPVQFQPESRGMSTDAFAINLTRAGVPSGLLSVPSRYMHSPVETISLKDADHTAELIAEFILGLSGRETWGATKFSSKK